MTEQATTRKCGNCGKTVGAVDIICPHCDVLLAAYEAPSGATVGTSLAVHPVDMTGHPSAGPAPATSTPSPPPPFSPQQGPRAPYVSPTAQTLDALDAHKPQVGATSTTFELPVSSPISEALQRTRAAANLDPGGEAPPEPEDAPRVSPPTASELSKPADVPEPPTELPAPVAAPEAIRPPERHDEPKSTAVERVRAQAEAGWFGGDTEAQHVAREATSPVSGRSTPEERAAHRTQPVRTGGTQQDRQSFDVDRIRQHAAPKGKSSVSFGTFVGAIIVFIILVRMLGSGALTGFIVIPIIIAGLIWFMAMVARSTGRKTTSMPKDKHRR